jgi:hypothetical protein
MLGLGTPRVTSTTRAAMPFGPIPSMIRPSPTFHRNSPKPPADRLRLPLRFRDAGRRRGPGELVPHHRRLRGHPLTPVDDPAVADLPQELSEALGRADEQPVVDLVDVPCWCWASCSPSGCTSAGRSCRTSWPRTSRCCTASPELVHALADEAVLEHQAGEERSQGEDRQRDRHHTTRRPGCSTRPS